MPAMSPSDQLEYSSLFDRADPVLQCLATPRPGLSLNDPLARSILYASFAVYKYKTHAATIAEIWKSLGIHARNAILNKAIKSRIDILEKAEPNSSVPDHVDLDFRRDLQEDGITPNCNFLIDILKHRTTKSAFELCRVGVNGDRGDVDYIRKITGADHRLPPKEKRKDNEIIVFTEGVNYGRPCIIKDSIGYQQATSADSEAVESRICVPASIGTWVIHRQLRIMLLLKVLIDDLLDLRPVDRDRDEAAARAKAAESEKAASLESISIEQLITVAAEQSAILSELFKALCTERAMFRHWAFGWITTKPGRVKDDNGHTVPPGDGENISSAIYELFLNFVVPISNWEYLQELLNILDRDPIDRVLSTLVLQELSNVCHFEYNRVKRLFHRYVKAGSGLKYCRENPGNHGKGKKPSIPLERSNPQLAYMLKICEPDTDIYKAIPWCQKIDHLHESSRPDEEIHMIPEEGEYYYDLVKITGLFKSLCDIFKMPPMNASKGQIYISRSAILAKKLDSHKPEFDLPNCTLLDLTEPNMIGEVLLALEKFIQEKMGKDLMNIYPDMLEDSVSSVQRLYQSQLQKTRKPVSNLEPSNRFSQDESQASVSQQKTKVRRPEPSSDYEPHIDAEPATEPSIQPESQVFKVKQTTVDTFSNLFPKTRTRRSIPWIAFESSMVDLGFSVIPKTGSIFTFFPPQDMRVQTPLVIHRGHGSHIEGRKLLSYATRLKKVYGWDENTFQVA